MMVVWIDVFIALISFTFFITSFLFHYELDDVGVTVKRVRNSETMKWSDVKKVKYYGDKAWRIVIFSDTAQLKIALLDKKSRNEVFSIIEEKAINIKGIDRSEFAYFHKVIEEE